METAVVECNHGCPECCEASPEQISADSDREARNRALTISGILTTILLVAHIFTFLEKGVSLPVPEVIWAVVLGPWLGHGASKLLELTKGVSK